jgi:hypothetical protein
MYCDSSSIALLVQDCFGYLGCFVLLYELQDYFSSSVKHVIEILMGMH